MRFALWLLFPAALAAAAGPLFQVVDIDAGTAEKVLVGGKTVTVKLLSTSEARNAPNSGCTPMASVAAADANTAARVSPRTSKDIADVRCLRRNHDASGRTTTSITNR